MPMSPRLLRPRARQAAAPPPSGTPASLLLRFDGNFDDSSPNALTVTVNGDAAISTTTKKWGSGAAAFDGAEDYIFIEDTSEAIGDRDFTLEMWAYFNALPNTSLYDCYEVEGDVSRANGFAFCIQDGALDVFGNEADGFGGAATAAIPTGEWVHLAICRISGVCHYFVNGTKDSTSFSMTNSITSTLGIIGKVNDSPAYYLDGYIDDLRIVKGLAVYTTNFTPPSAPLSPYATAYVPRAITSPSLWKSETLRPLYHWST